MIATRSPRPEPSPLRPARVCFIQTLGLLLLGLTPLLGPAPLPYGWARAALDSARSPELNRGDREISAGGYYEGIIGVGEFPPGGRADLAVRLLGKPTDWVRFEAAHVMHPLPNGDFLQFELKPSVDKVLFGHPFTTNRHGMRDREYSVERPAGTFRVVLLGSSIDMGWGIGIEETYANLLEDWLNSHAVRRGLNRRFEVLNFAVAAYSPLQRLEAYRRKARLFRPDLVLYSGTMLDRRLMEIHLCDLFRGHATVPPEYDFVRETIIASGLTDEDLLTDPHDQLIHKDEVKRKLRPHYWGLYDRTIAALAADCRSDGVPLALLIIPRVGKADAPAARAESIARFEGIAAHNAVPLFDLSTTFDERDPSRFEIAAWDDHPNALGHRRLFLGLTRALVDDQGLYETLFLSRPEPMKSNVSRYEDNDK
jgi:hypothetical protein